MARGREDIWDKIKMKSIGIERRRDKGGEERKNRVKGRERKRLKAVEMR